MIFRKPKPDSILLNNHMKKLIIECSRRCTTIQAGRMYTRIQILLNTDRKKDAGEGERVELSTVVEPDADRNKGSVERWLVEMEQSMRDTLKEIARKVRYLSTCCS